MLENLRKMLENKKAKKAELDKRAKESNNVDELRGINKSLEEINEEIRGLESMIKGLEEKETPPAVGNERTAAVNGEIPGVVVASATSQKPKEERTADKFDSVEYRQAFMDYCIRGVEIPQEYRSDTFTAVADAASVIPTSIMNEIIKQMKVRGHIFSRVRKTSIPGGVQVPILSLKPTATRITESAPSERKKLTANTHITFSYYGLECKVATSLLASIVTLAQFEAEIVPLITEAMITKIEIEIFKGSGIGEQLGITIDTRVAAGQKITLSSSEFTRWDEWKKKVFAKIPLAYRNYSIYMGAGTFEGYIDGMVDANGQPIARTNYGIADGPTYRFGGKEVVEVEEDVITSYDNADVGDVVAVFVNLQDYVINSNMQMAMYRWLDHDTNQWVDKAILINDGKLIDAAGVLIVKKGA